MIVVKTHFEVRFSYYQYNSGCCDNGFFEGIKIFETYKGACAFKDVVDMAYQALCDERYDSISYKKGNRIVEGISKNGTGKLQSFAEVFEIQTRTTKLL